MDTITGSLDKDEKNMEYKTLTEEIIGSAFAVYNQMGYGYLESVYEKCLEIEFAKKKISARFQVPLKAKYEGQVVGDFIADIVAEDKIVIELKSIRKTNRIHEAQLVNYLKCTGFDHGLLMNFGEQKVEVKRKIRELSLLKN